VSASNAASSSNAPEFVLTHVFDAPREVLHTVTFTERDSKTTVTMRGVPVNTTEAERKTFEAGRDSMQKGFAGPFQPLAQYLASGRTGKMS